MSAAIPRAPAPARLLANSWPRPRAAPVIATTLSRTFMPMPLTQAGGDRRQRGDVDPVARRLGNEGGRISAVAHPGERPLQGRAGAAAAMRDHRQRFARQYRREDVDVRPLPARR